MTSRRRIGILILFVLFATPAVHSDKGGWVEGLLKDLLEMPAPMPTAAEGAAMAPDEASEPSLAEQVLRHWRGPRQGGAAEASGEELRLLLAALEEYPRELAGVIEHLPPGAETEALIQRIYDEAVEASWPSDSWKKEVRKWLVLNSPYLREELIALARSASDDDGRVVGEDELIALAGHDGSAARSVLEGLASQGVSRTATLASTLLYQLAVESGDAGDAEELRDLLRRIVEDPSRPGYSRDRAAEALLRSEWAGRDDWYIQLFQDDTLREVRDGIWSRSPLRGPVSRDPDHWIPRIVALVGHPNPAVHDNAVEILVSFHLGRARADALEPLLPWLHDPDWSSASDRLRLIQSVDLLGLREAIPGLIHVVENEDGPLRSYAADSLGSLRAKEAGSAVRRALASEAQSAQRQRIATALLQCGGLTIDEMVEAVEAFAVQLSTPEGAEAWRQFQYSFRVAEQPPDPAVSVGAVISRADFEPPPGLAGGVLDALPRLDAENPPAGAVVRRILGQWPDLEIDRLFVRELAAARVDAADVAEALQRREDLRVHLGRDLRDLVDRGGLAAGVAAVLLAERPTSEAVLAEDDTAARTAVLASARLVRDPLPLAAVGELLGEPPGLLALAAERFLEAEDSPEARRLILDRHRGEARILGARLPYDPGHSSSRQLDAYEEELRREVLRRDGPDQVVALLSAGYWGGAGQRILWIDERHALFAVCSDAARCRERFLLGDEIDRLQAFLDETAFANLGPLDTGTIDGVQWEFVHLTRDGGRRVFMNNPDLGDGSAYSRLVELFFDLEKAAPLEVSYHTAAQIPGFEVLRNQDEQPVVALCEDGGSLWLLLGDESGGEWQTLDAGQLRSRSDPPARCRRVFTTEPPKSVGYDPLGALNTWQQESPESQILANGRGLWRWDGSGEPVKLVEGWFGATVVTPDGRWAVAARTPAGENWAPPNLLVRVELASGVEKVLDVEPADQLDPIAYLEERGRILIRRAADQETFEGRDPVGPRVPEYRLLNPEDGLSEIVTGDFGPLEQAAFRELQPAAVRGESWVWVAIPDYAGNSTMLGLYDLSELVLEPFSTIPAIAFDTMDMWVEDGGASVLVAYRGDLLRIPVARGSASGH